MDTLQLAKNLDQIVVQSNELRQQQITSLDQLIPFLDLVQCAINDLQSENLRLFNQACTAKQGLISALESKANA